MGKIKHESDSIKQESGDTSVKGETVDELSYEEKVANCNEISKPMASKKLAKKCYKLVKKGNKFLFTIYQKNVSQVCIYKLKLLQKPILVISCLLG